MNAETYRSKVDALKEFVIVGKNDGADLKGVNDLEAALLLSNGEKGNVIGIIKNIISD